VFVGSEPGQVAIAPDGQYLYVVLEGAMAIRRVDLINRTAGLQLPMPRKTIDIDVMPGHPGTIAVVDDDQAVTIYDDAVARSNTAERVDAVVFDPDNPARLYGAETKSGTSDFVRMSVSSTGVSVDDETNGLLSGTGFDLQMDDGLLSNGVSVIDPRTLVNASAVPNGFTATAFVFDGGARRLWGLRTTPVGNILGPNLVSIDATTRQVLDVFRFDAGPSGASTLRRSTVVAAGEQQFAVVVAGTFVIVDLGWLHGASGEYTPLTPGRVLDTRSGLGGASRLGSRATARVQISGRGGVPESGVEAIVLNATAADPSADTYLTIWPSGDARPEISSLNLVAGLTRANLVTVALGDGGRLDMYNDRGAVDVLFDVVGYYATASGNPGSRYRPVSPQRTLDTRSGLGSLATAPVGSGQTLEFKVTGSAGVPETGVTAVILNVTATDATEATYLTVWPQDSPRPVASTVNVTAGRAVPNLAIVRVPASGIVSFYNDRGAVQVIADVFGYYTSDRTGDRGRFVPFTPTRLLDTRLTDESTCCNVEIRKQTDYHGFEELYGAYVLNVAVTKVTGDGYVTAYPYPAAKPVVSNLNYVAGESVANAAIVPTGPYMVLNKSAGELHFIADAFGAFIR
jgi:hypothetical protein